MSGEILVQTIDMARFEAIAPALDALDAGAVLDAEALEVLKAAIGSPMITRSRAAPFADILRRIIRQPDLAPRLFLSPSALDGAILCVLDALCFENGGAWSLNDRVGPNWTVIEHAAPALQDHQQLGEMFYGPGADFRALAHPRRGESARLVAQRHVFAPMRAELADVIAEAEAEGARWIAEEARGLAALAARAEATPALSLAHLSLL